MQKLRNTPITFNKKKELEPLILNTTINSAKFHNLCFEFLPTFPIINGFEHFSQQLLFKNNKRHCCSTI